ncbi:MAG: TolC family protein [Candidatus Gastranaerophilales bacterium]|nr:TolC family protein [Candidatus Gastranaerophilales bacterium]
MKKFISSVLLLSFMGMGLSPAQAFFKMGVEKSTQIEQSKKTDKQLYKTVKSKKDVPFGKLKVQNKYDFINIQWWESFNDPYLTEYINRAMTHNFDLKIATLTVDEYYQNVRLQMANELPQIQGGYGAGVVGLPPLTSGERDTGHGMGLPFIASYEADIFLKNHDKTTSARKLYQATISDERAAYISIVSSVGTVYYNIVRLDKSIELQEDIVDLRKNVYELMALSNKEGVVSTSDMIKANKSYIAGQSDLIDLKRQRNELLNQLAVLIGESPENIGEFKRISFDEIQYNANIPENIPSDIIMQRPDYVRAEVMLKKAGIDVKIAKKEFLPTISITGLALFNAKHLGSIFTTKNMLWSVGGSAMLPIFTGGSRIANFKINKVRFEKALREYQKTNLTAIQEVNDALYTAKLNNQKLQQNTEHLDLETKDFGLTLKKYEQGVASKLDLAQTKENLLSIQKLVASNTLDCMIDSINIYKATGAKFQ